MKLVSPNFSDLLTPNIEIKQFPDGENYVRITIIEQCKGKDVTLFHRLYPDQDKMLIQALFILNILKKVDASVTLVSPYLPYARQDKIFLEGEPASAEIICKLLADAGVKKLVTFDCHFLKKEGTFKYGGLTIENISMARYLLEHAEKKFNETFIVVSPDVGASYMAEKFGGGHMKKVRGGYAEGKEAYREIEILESNIDFNNKSVLILDDIVSTGGTMIRAVENAKKGNAKRIVCAATHGLFLKDSLSTLKSLCDYVFASDSVPSSVSYVSIKIALKDLL
jgi:ribose-phosphate pyrophosphokinase